MIGFVTIELMNVPIDVIIVTLLFNWSFVLRDVQKASNLMSEEIRPRYIVTRVRLLNATEIKKKYSIESFDRFFFNILLFRRIGKL